MSLWHTHVLQSTYGGAGRRNVLHLTRAGFAYLFVQRVCGGGIQRGGGGIHGLPSAMRRGYHAKPSSAVNSNFYAFRNLWNFYNRLNVLVEVQVCLLIDLPSAMIY